MLKHVSVLHSALSTNNISLYGYTICLSIRQLGCFYVLAVMNNASKKHSCTSFSVDTFLFFSFPPRGGVAKSYVNSMFNHLRKCQTFLRRLYHFTFPAIVGRLYFLHILDICYHLTFILS